MNLSFTPFPTLLTDRLVLRQLADTDEREVLFIRSDERVMQYIDRPPAQGIEDARKFIAMILDNAAKNEAVLWGITLKGKDRLIGNIGFWNILKEHYRAELGYALHPDFQGQGIMSEAMQAVLEYGFNTMKAHSIMANVNPDNIPSIKLLERNDFVKEAHFKEDYFYNGKFMDTLIFSLLNKKDVQ